MGNNMDNEQIIYLRSSLKKQIKFLKYMIKHLDGNDGEVKVRAVLTALCLDNYYEKGLIADIELVIKKVGSNL